MNPEVFWEMGGYARYVWSAYGLALGSMVAHLALLAVRHRRLRRRLARRAGRTGSDGR